VPKVPATRFTDKAVSVSNGAFGLPGGNTVPGVFERAIELMSYFATTYGTCRDNVKALAINQRSADAAASGLAVW
jgi:hypothetical protein